MIIPATGEWWVRIRVVGSDHSERDRVAAWLIIGDDYDGANASCLPLIANGGRLDRVAYVFDGLGDLDIDIFHGDALPGCRCGSRRGADDDPGWCPPCGGLLLR